MCSVTAPAAGQHAKNKQFGVERSACVCCRASRAPLYTLMHMPEGAGCLLTAWSP